MGNINWKYITGYIGVILRDVGKGFGFATGSLIALGVMIILFKALGV